MIIQVHNQVAVEEQELHAKVMMVAKEVVELMLVTAEAVAVALQQSEQVIQLDKMVVPVNIVQFQVQLYIMLVVEVVHDQPTHKLVQLDQAMVVAVEVVTVEKVKIPHNRLQFQDPMHLL
jgi:hypothetical protein